MAIPGKQTRRMATALLAALALVLVAGCGGDGGRDGDADDDDDDSGGPRGSIGGTVLAPNGTTPIAGALVYLTTGDAPEIPGSVFCYECDDMTGKAWVLTNPDGTWQMENVAAREWNLVARKGMFRRQRAVTVDANEHLDVPVSLTTLPGEASADGLDRIPNYAVLLSQPDETFKLLGKFGMAQMSGSDVVWGTETFDAFNDNVSQPGYPPSTELFSDQQTIDGYHMIFLPCYGTGVGLSFADSRTEMIRSYVSAGGKVYNSCCVSFWSERSFPDYVDFYGDDSAWAWDIGRVSSTALSTQGAIADLGLRDWLQVVSPASNLDSFPFVYGYTKIDGVDSVHGHGVEEDDYWVHPRTWVTGSADDVYQASPLMVTYSHDCGKVFYSVYETSQNKAEITPQEYVLLYIILEIGVCEGEYTVE